MFILVPITIQGAYSDDEVDEAFAKLSELVDHECQMNYAREYNKPTWNVYLVGGPMAGRVIRVTSGTTSYEVAVATGLADAVSLGDFLNDPTPLSSSHVTRGRYVQMNGKPPLQWEFVTY